MTTLFEKIIAGDLPCEKVFESDHVIAFHDIAPVAPVHILIVSKKVIPRLQDAKEEDLPLIAEMMQVAQQVAKQFGIEKGYRLITNNGENAGQTVLHLHFHLIGGKQLGSLA